MGEDSGCLKYNRVTWITSPAAPVVGWNTVSSSERVAMSISMFNSGISAFLVEQTGFGAVSLHDLYLAYYTVFSTS